MKSLDFNVKLICALRQILNSLCRVLVFELVKELSVQQLLAVTAKGTGPQDRTGPQGRVDVDVTPPTGGPVGHPPNPATLCDRSAQGSKS